MNAIPLSTSFAIASPNIVHETFDDEVVIVSLDSGSYYSMAEVGMACWQQILAGCSVEKIVESLSSAYEADAHSVRDSVIPLLNEMEAEQLIVRLDRPAENEAPVSARPSEKKAFQPPVLYRYEDMKQLLVIDPVHMVSDDGWPQIRRMDDAGQ
jgi:hypothetical protein